MRKVDDAYSARRTAGNAKAVMIGKVLSSVATLLWLGLSVRLLGVEQYASYITAIAAMELTVAVGSFGLDWVVLRYAPEFVVRRAGTALRAFLIKALVLRLVTTALAAGLLYVVLVQGWLPHTSAAGPLAGAVVVLAVSEAALRMIRDSTLESVGAVRYTQVGVLLRTAIVVALALGHQHLFAPLDSARVLLIEVTASLMTLVFSALALRHTLAGLASPCQHAPTVTNSPLPALRSAIRLGIQNYLSLLVSYSMSTQTLILAVSSMASAGQVSTFGFVCRLFDIARGYMPTLVLLSSFRPRLIGLYASTADWNKLTSEIDVLNRLNLLAITTIAPLVLLAGDLIIRTLSNSAIRTGGFELGLVVLCLSLRSLRLLKTLQINIAGQGNILIAAALASVGSWIFAAPFWMSEHYLLGLVGIVAMEDVLWLSAVWKMSGRKMIEPRQVVRVGIKSLLIVVAVYLCFRHPMLACGTGDRISACQFLLLAVAATAAAALSIYMNMVSPSELKTIQGALTSKSKANRDPSGAN